MEAAALDSELDLSEEENAILSRQVDAVPKLTDTSSTSYPSVSYLTLFTVASYKDKFMLFIALISSIVSGATFPFITIFFGKLSGSFSRFTSNEIGESELMHQISLFSIMFVYVALVEFVTVFLSMALSAFVGERITRKIRLKYFNALLRQNIAFFDATTPVSTFTTNMFNIQDGISEKLSLVLSTLSTFVAAMIIAFIHSRKFALILTFFTVFLISLCSTLSSYFVLKFSSIRQEQHSQSDSLTLNILSSLQTIFAYHSTAVPFFARKLDHFNKKAVRWGYKVQISLALMLGSLMFILYLSYALAFWVASVFIVRDQLTVSKAITCIFSLLLGAFSLGHVAPYFKAFSSATTSAEPIFATIYRKSPIDSLSTDGVTLPDVQGCIELRHVKHVYPSRSDVKVMNDVSLTIPAGKTTAIVGVSGSGKSTIIGLLERFYNPIGGEILLDGVNIQEMNVCWLRQQISIVSQDPTLFSTTIKENILYGLKGEHDLSDEKTNELVIQAAKLANAHDFIVSLPHGYDTFVGEQGLWLSGGQKQRISIARAVISNPKILLLDEATSALDAKSEDVVQIALESVSKGRTTIVIAHRLSTVKNAHQIVVVNDGRVIETGTHQELLNKQGLYYMLVEAQTLKSSGLNEKTLTGNSDSPTVDAVAYTTESEPEKYKSDYLDKDRDVERSVLSSPKRDSTLGLVGFVLKFNRKEWPLMVVGFIAALVTGTGQPLQSIFYAKSISVLSYPPNRYAALRHDINLWGGMYIMLAVVQLVAYMVQNFIFGLCSERLVYRVRNKIFRTLLRQDASYFDSEDHSVGSLTSTISSETNNLTGMSGVTLGTVLSISSSLVTCFILALCIGWKLSLVVSATIPVLLVAGFLRFWILARFNSHTQNIQNKYAGFACEVMSSIRTVASLTRESEFSEIYRKRLVQVSRESIRPILTCSAVYAMSQSLSFLCISLGFWFGGRLIATREYSIFQFFVCFSAIIFGSQSAGHIFGHAPDIGKAKDAALKIKRLFDRKPVIDNNDPDMLKLSQTTGDIEFQNISFAYPTRPDQVVLRGLSFQAKPGQFIALVGPSGSGKSTTISLLERFYTPDAGQILLDGINISTLDLTDYRKQFALVSQEAAIFTGSILENILLGYSEDVPEERIKQACMDANIYDFIVSLPDGFNTQCGPRGALLSGGQKQRISIARALIRDPKVLLLDEATSALNSDSEQIVKEALIRASKGRTTIAIAHRLSSIQNADFIYVIDSGRVIEAGTHDELVGKGGKYAELVALQSLD